MSPLDVLREFWPSVPSTIRGGVWGALLCCAAGWLAAKMNRRGWRVGDTRKVFHFTIFTGAAVLRWQVDPPAVAVYGCVVTLVVFTAVWLGPRSRLFLAMARPSDVPYEKLHIVAPLVCTAVGGVVAHMIAGPLATVAYLVAGWGDAVGEPVGIRWGQHQYPVPAWGQLKARRSVEGSAAVFVASALAAGLGLMLCGRSGMEVVGASLLIAAAATVVEAVSPHGWDNLTLLVAVAWLSRFWVG